MKSVLWTGKLTFPIRLLININNILSWILGNTKKKNEMKERVMQGYDGKFSDHIKKYDELTAYYQKRTAVAQVEGIDFQEKDVIDIGCGTGIIALLTLDKGAKMVICGDISNFMLEQSKKNAAKLGYNPEQIQYCQLDAESLPFEDNIFDIVITGMSFGLFPDQKKAVSEMVRVVKPGGMVSLGAHGPEHYWEAADTTLRGLTKRHLLGYRLEFWPRTEKQIYKLLANAGLDKVTTNRFIWRNLFEDPVVASDFFAAVTSNWWYSAIPENKRSQEYEKTRQEFTKRNVRVITDDVIIANGYKT